MLTSHDAEPRDAVDLPSPELAPRLERAATWLSAACAVHCMLVPVASAALPLFGVSGSTLMGGSAEHWFNALVILGALSSLAIGYRRHRDLRIAMAMSLALATYLLGHALEGNAVGVGLAVVGGLSLAASSFWSARQGHLHLESCDLH